MNRSLIERIWILTRKQLLILGSIVVIVVFFTMIMGRMSGGIAAGIGMIMFLFYLLHAIFEKEAKNNGFCFLLSMPYKRREIVQNMYFTIWGGAILMWVLAEIVQIILVFFIEKKIGLSASYGMIGTGICFAVSGIVFGVLMPLYLKMDYAKATLYSQIMLLLAITVGVMLGRSLPFLDFQSHTYQAWYEVIAALVGFIFIAVSYPISIRIFEKREF